MRIFIWYTNFGLNNKTLEYHVEVSNIYMTIYHPISCAGFGPTKEFLLKEEIVLNCIICTPMYMNISTISLDIQQCSDTSIHEYRK